MPSTFDYNPQAKYEVRSFDVPYQEALGQPLEATIYQPEGTGRFLPFSSSTAAPGTREPALVKRYSTPDSPPAVW